MVCIVVEITERDKKDTRIKEKRATQQNDNPSPPVILNEKHFTYGVVRRTRSWA